MGEFEEKINGLLSNPEEMQKIMSLARSITGSGDTPLPGDSPPPATEKAEESGSSLFENLDPKLLQSMGKLMGQFNSPGAAGGDKSALLNALCPYLKEERQEQLHRAMNIAKMAKVAKVAFSDLGGGDVDV